MTDRPDIISVVERYGVSLRRAGKEQIGLCPLHVEKHPSFAVNADKGVFFCFGCGAGGDVIRFVELIEAVDFKAACKLLSLDTYRPQPRPHRAEAEQIVAWGHELSLTLRDLLREIGDDIYLCFLAGTDKDFIRRHEEELSREWEILTAIDDDLNEPKRVVEVWRQRLDIERIIDLARYR